jgi:hypothetical protein
MNNNQNNQINYPINITTGVMSLHDTNLDLFLSCQESIDPELELYLEKDPDLDCIDWSPYYELFGDWKKVEEQNDPDYGKYTEDKNSKDNYSAILNNDYNTIQVTFSNVCVLVGLCSPCYPNQGDLDANPNKNCMGDPVWAYCLPFDLLSKKWLIEKEIEGKNFYQNNNEKWEKVNLDKIIKEMND